MSSTIEYYVEIFHPQQQKISRDFNARVCFLETYQEIENSHFLQYNVKSEAPFMSSEIKTKSKFKRKDLFL